jgi:hypothetical protein
MPLDIRVIVIRPTRPEQNWLVYGTMSKASYTLILHPNHRMMLLCEHFIRYVNHRWHNRLISSLVGITRLSRRGYVKSNFQQPRVKRNLAPQLLLICAKQFCRRAQDIMSSTASNYDVPRLFSGIAIASASIVSTILAAWNLSVFQRRDCVCYFLILILYGIMMFASSYVEEEQHFWYWVTGGWIFYQGLRK